MAIEVIDGTIEAAVLKRSGAATILYDSITIRTADGSQRRLDKVAVAPDVAAALEPGTEGRFYGYKAIDHRGLFAMRTRDGRSAFAVPTGNERIMLVMAIAGLAGFVVLLLLGKGIGLLALVLGVLGAIGYLKYRSTRTEGRARYDSDKEYTRGFA
ncbi:MAG TPA: hypothetical protein VK403_03905 [Allosphingosinicella sp.]|nr:hypothetical protein [Allosphingosinicella sp.]